MAVFVDYEVKNVHFLGHLPKKYKSSEGVIRGFCGICGSTMTYEGQNTPNLIHIHLGIFDKPELFTPMENENIETQLSWVCIQTVK